MFHPSCVVRGLPAFTLLGIGFWCATARESQAQIVTRDQAAAALELPAEEIFILGDGTTIGAGWRVVTDDTYDGVDALRATTSTARLTFRRGPARWISLRAKDPDPASGRWTLLDIPLQAGQEYVLRTGAGTGLFDSMEVTLVPSVPLGDAMGRPTWPWTAGGTPGWFTSAQPGTSQRFGATAILTAENPTAWIETTVPGPGIFQLAATLASGVTHQISLNGAPASPTSKVAITQSGPVTVRWAYTHSGSASASQGEVVSVGPIEYSAAGTPATPTSMQEWSGMAWSLVPSTGAFQWIDTMDATTPVPALRLVQPTHLSGATQPTTLRGTLPGPGRLRFEYQGKLESTLAGDASNVLYIEPSIPPAPPTTLRPEPPVWNKADVVWPRSGGTEVTLSAVGPFNLGGYVEPVVLRRLRWEPATRLDYSAAVEATGISLPKNVPPEGGLTGLPWAADGEDALFRTTQPLTVTVTVPGLFSWRERPNATSTTPEAGLAFPWRQRFAYHPPNSLGTTGLTIASDHAGRDAVRYLELTEAVGLPEAVDFPVETSGQWFGIGGPAGAELSRDGVDVAAAASGYISLPVTDEGVIEYWARGVDQINGVLAVQSSSPAAGLTTRSVTMPGLALEWRKFGWWHHPSRGSRLRIEASGATPLRLVDQVRWFRPEPVALADALDLPPGLTVTTDPARPWRGLATGGWSRDGVDAAEGPLLSPGESTWLRVHLPGPGRIVAARQIEAPSAAAATSGVTSVLESGAAGTVETDILPAEPNPQSPPRFFSRQAHVLRSPGPQAIQFAATRGSTELEAPTIREWLDTLAYEPAVSLAEAGDHPGLGWRTDPARPWIGLASASLAPDGTDFLLGPERDDRNELAGWIEAEMTGPLTLSYVADGVDVPHLNGRPWGPFSSAAQNNDGRMMIHVPGGRHTLRWHAISRNKQGPRYLDDFRAEPDGPMAGLANDFFWFKRGIPVTPPLAEQDGHSTAWEFHSLFTGRNTPAQIMPVRFGRLSYQARTTNGVPRRLSVATHPSGPGATYVQDPWRDFHRSVGPERTDGRVVPDFVASSTTAGSLHSVLQFDNATFTPSPSPTVDEALDTPGLVWSAVSPAVTPLYDPTLSRDGIDAVIVEMPDASVTPPWIESTVTGPGRLSLWIRGAVDARIDVDGVATALIESFQSPLPWQQVHVDVPTGLHIVRLTVLKASGMVVDQAEFTTRAPAELTALGARLDVPAVWIGQPSVMAGAGRSGGAAIELIATPISADPATWGAPVPHLFAQRFPVTGMMRAWWRDASEEPTASPISRLIGTLGQSQRGALPRAWRRLEIPALSEVASPAVIECRDAVSTRTMISDVEWVPLNPVSAAEALDAPTFAFEVIGEGAGVAGDIGAYRGGDAIMFPWQRTGAAATRVRTSVEGPGILSFWMKGGGQSTSLTVLPVAGNGVSIEPGATSSIAEPAWQPVDISIGSGPHVVEWSLISRMAPDGSAIPTLLDAVEWRVDPIYAAFLDWLEFHAVPWPQRTPSGDADGDGWPALLEYVSGLSPISPDPMSVESPLRQPSPPLMRLVTGGDLPLQLQVEYVQRVGLGANVISLQHSIDGATSWHPLTGGQRTESPLPAAPEWVAVSVLVPLADAHPAELFRLRVQLP